MVVIRLRAGRRRAPAVRPAEIEPEFTMMNDTLPFGPASGNVRAARRGPFPCRSWSVVKSGCRCRTATAGPLSVAPAHSGIGVDASSYEHPRFGRGRILASAGQASRVRWRSVLMGIGSMLDAATNIRNPKSVSKRVGGRSVVGLDLLRFGAAALVMSFHLACTSWSDPRSEAAGLMAGAVRYPEFLSLSRNGWVGVPIFFVISGFVIAFSAEQSTARRFLKSRILRLMPGIWICATVSFLLALSFAPDSGLVSTERYLRTLVVVPIPRWIDGVYWTLSIEMSFYALVWALLLRHQLRRLETIMIAIGLCSAVIWGLADSAWIPGLDILANKRIAQLLLVTHGCDFALGVLIWRLSKDGVTAWRLSAGLVCLVGAVFQIMVDERSVFRDLKLGAPDALASEIFLIFVGLFALAIWGKPRLPAFPSSKGPERDPSDGPRHLSALSASYFRWRPGHSPRRSSGAGSRAGARLRNGHRHPGRAAGHPLCRAGPAASARRWAGAAGNILSPGSSRICV